ncbi:MAG TPA: ABC transporter permease [Acidimicrobiales bacterium]|jgi:ABC-type nitrate/sulfonate/bicarbonate transport system permease component|nr:ABC transporter permease [Acidimicrobiales bacterium]
MARAGSMAAEQLLGQGEPRYASALESRGRPSFYRRHERVLLGLASIVVVIAAWQVCSDLGVVNPLFASSPSLVARAGYHYVTSAAFGRDIGATGLAFAIGFALSVVAGVVIGFAIGWYRRVNYALDYLISFAYAAPRIALIPIIIVWFGIGVKASVAIVFLLAVFPVLVNTANGVRTVDPTLVEMARSLGVSRWDMFRTVLLPAAVPSIMTGIRLSVGLGLVGVIVAEFLASTAGIGYMMSNAASNYDTTKVFVGLVIMSVLGVVLTELFKRIEHYFDRWRPAGR